MKNTIGQRIRSARAALNLTQPQLAEKIGVHAITICKWEKDAWRPEKRSLVALSAVLGIELF